MSCEPLQDPSAGMPKTPVSTRVFATTKAVHADGAKGLRLGFDLVEISQIAHSIDCFGEAFKHRLFTSAELDYVQRAEGLCNEGLAARFAAKEAVIKALQFSEAGIDWRDIEVLKLPSGECQLLLHGRAALLASQMGVRQLLLSMSHDGGYAGAVVTAMVHKPARAALTIHQTIHQTKGRRYASS